MAQNKDWQLRGFPLMKDIIPEGVSGEYAVEHYSIPEDEARLAVTVATYNRDYLGREIFAGDFCKLTHKDEILMSDSGGERYSNTEIVHNAYGNVLIAGLGLGMVLCAILPKPAVRSVTVVEISPDVCRLVLPHLAKYLGKHFAKLSVVQDDIYNYVPNRKFNIIYFDIWGNYSGDDYEKTKILHRRYSKYLDRTNGHWMDSWMRWHMKELHFNDRY